MDKKKLLIIVLTTSAKEKIEKSEQNIDDVREDLNDLDNIRLFYYKTDRDREENRYGRIALPFGKKSLMLLQESNGKNENYFLAIDFWHGKASQHEFNKCA